MSLPLSVSLYLFSFTFNILFSIYSWINQLKQGFPIQMDSSAQHPSNEIINSSHYCKLPLTGFLDLFLAICLSSLSRRMSKWFVMLRVPPPGLFLTARPSLRPPPRRSKVWKLKLTFSKKWTFSNSIRLQYAAKRKQLKAIDLPSIYYFYSLLEFPQFVRLRINLSPSLKSCFRGCWTFHNSLFYFEISILNLRAWVWERMFQRKEIVYTFLRLQINGDCLIFYCFVFLYQIGGYWVIENMLKTTKTL